MRSRNPLILLDRENGLRRGFFDTRRRGVRDGLGGARLAQCRERTSRHSDPRVPPPFIGRGRGGWNGPGLRAFPWRQVKNLKRVSRRRAERRSG
jgi:hypothetical protein